jgi:alpha-ketoglutarate-dependent 2,4-dichlorophenoxyacetate dioxygenase
MVALTPLHPLFAACVEGIDVARGIDAATGALLRAAIEQHQVLVFRNQRITDAAQLAFSRHFGPLEATRPQGFGAGSDLITLSNFGADGRIVPPTDRQTLNNLANRSWHHDSSFKPVPAKLSILSAREIPREGGDTEFASMRAAWAEMPAADRAMIAGRVAIHDFAWSRARVSPALVTDAERAAHPPVRQAAVLESPHGPALYLGAHARTIEGMAETDARALIDRLIAFATADRFVYAHKWQPDDLVVWHNRAVAHRATPFRTSEERRHLVRTTVAGDGPTVAA